jgi:hypothetical protein
MSLKQLLQVQKCFSKRFTLIVRMTRLCTCQHTFDHSGRIRKSADETVAGEDKAVKPAGGTITVRVDGNFDSIF